MQVSDNCAICLSVMKRKKVIRLLPCRHLLHEVCTRSMSEGRNCPICRGLISGREEVISKRYNKYSNQDRLRVVQAANRGEDWGSLATSLGIKYKTAFTWVNSGECVPAQKGGTKPKILTEAQINIILQWVEENSTITLKEIASRVYREFGKTVTNVTISNYLENQLFTTKSVHIQPVTMNNEENKRKRAEYVNKLTTYVREGKQIAYMDETNFNLFCRRTRGRSRAGTRAVQTLPASRGPNIHVIGAITASGVICMERRRGSFKAADAGVWLCSLLDRWTEMGNNLEDLVIVCDNAPCHSRLESAIDEYDTEQKPYILRLGPYSPMLNPIENIWSKIKTHVKANIGIPQTIGAGVGEQRLAYMERLIDNAISTITAGDCGRAIQHSSSFYADALALVDMAVGV